MNLANEIARVMCCPGGTCAWPQHCYASRRGEQTLVDIRSAAEAVARTLPPLLCELWRKEAGPYSATTRLPGSGGTASGFSGSAGGQHTGRAASPSEAATVGGETP